MRIVFYAKHKKWGGLANNGGSRTILKSAETLQSLGHKVNVAATVDRFTYFEHKKPINKIPKNTNVCIAVSILDTIPMLKEMSKLPRNCRPFVWIRGWETWRVPEKMNLEILRRFKKFGGTILVNSEWLRDSLIENNIMPSYIIYPGYDEIYAIDRPKPYRLTKTIGTLYHKSKHKGYKFWLKVKERLGNEYDYIEIGREPRGDEEQIHCYQKCDIWFSAVTLEGLHNCAMEAALCGCSVVHNNCDSNGIWDYSGQYCAEIYETGNVEEAVKKIKKIDRAKKNNMHKRIINHISSREGNMKELVEVLND